MPHEDEEFGSNEDYLGREPDEPEEGADDPVARKRREDCLEARCKRELLSLGFAEDEIALMFKTPEEMEDFLRDHRRGGFVADGKDIQSLVEAEEIEPEPEDDFEMDADQVRKYLSHRKISKPIEPPKAVESLKTNKPTKKKKK